MSNLIRNKVTERDIRDWLNENGYDGGSAVLESVDLYAIKRPGWKQLFRFVGKIRRKAKANSSDETPDRQSVWGVVLNDERKPLGQRTDVAFFDSEELQMEQLKKLSVDMFRAKSGSEREFSGWSLLWCTLFFVAALSLVALVKRLYG